MSRLDYCAAPYYEAMCEGCQGSGASSWECDETSEERPFCECSGCTDNETCIECGGAGYYDPDPADEDEQQQLVDDFTYGARA